MKGMAEQYYDPKDLAALDKLRALAPEEFRAWANLDRIVGRKDGRIPHKYRELIAVAVAHTTQCPYCIQVHTKAARKAGATREQIAEAVFLAAALRAGGAAAHGLLALKFLHQD